MDRPGSITASDYISSCSVPIKAVDAFESFIQIFCPDHKPMKSQNMWPATKNVHMFELEQNKAQIKNRIISLIFERTQKIARTLS